MRPLAISVLLSILLSGPAPPASVAAERASVAAGRVASGIRVDGILDEPEWSAARPIRDFRLIFRREGEAPSESTEVRVLFDDGRIYFGVRCENRGPGPVRASLVPRDQVTDGDFVAIHLDTYRDRRRAYVFGVNPYGVQLDGILDGDEPDFSWDAVWDAETTRDPFGWTAEIAVPLRSIRYPRGGDGTWGLWIRREITKNDEVCSWPLWRQSVQGDIMLQAADLTGMTGLRGGGRLEAEPYVSSITNRTSAYSRLTPSPGGPSILDLFRSQHTTTDVGGDLRYPLTSTLVANATINPDFSQIEADAIQIDVNRRYPLFYSEKRPFFLEGAELFTTPLGLVYTRRFADPSVGGKLTGKQGRVSLGMILLRDEDGASAEGVGGGGGGFLRPGQFHVARVAYDAGENSRLGVLAAYHRSDDRSGGIVPAVIPAAPLAQGGGNTVLAADARLRLASRVFFNGQLAWSRTRVDSSSDVRGRDIVAHSTVTDAAYDARLSYADGARELEAYQTYYGPDFRDESGFISRVDMRRSGINSSWIVRPENRWVRSWQPILNGYVTHDATGGLQDWWVSPMVDWAFQKQTTMHTMYVRSMERWLGRDYDLNTYIYNLGNTLWRSLAVEFEMQVGDGIFYGETPEASYRGWAEEYTTTVTFRPEPRLTSEVIADRRRFARGLRGAEVYDIWALGAKTTFQFTRRLSARVYPQYDTGARHFDADALLGYVVHPGSVLYLGVNGDYDRVLGRQRQTQRTVFFKASYRFGV